MCSGELDIKSIPNPNGWSGLTDTNIEQYRNLFESIRGISSQTVNDLIDVITKFRQNFTVPIFIEKIVSVAQCAQFSINFFPSHMYLCD